VTAPFNADAQHARALAVADLLDLTLGQWEAWLVDASVRCPAELEPHAVNFIHGLRDREHYQLYLQSLATLTTSALHYFIAEVGRF
jgi:hypothetical protein